jgi:hypothetical protein
MSETWRNRLSPRGLLVRKKGGIPRAGMVQESVFPATDHMEEEANMGSVVTAGPTGRVEERTAGARRAQVVVRRLNVWSVLRVSLLFYFCVMVILVFALAILYWVLGIMGVLGSVSDLLTSIFPGRGTYAIDGGWLFIRALFLGLAWVVIWSLVNMFLALLYNLIADVVGGLKVTLGEPK